MGCCVSTGNSSPPQKTPRISAPKAKTTAELNVISKSPPPTNPLHGEETIKEVLSETPSSISERPSAAIPGIHEEVETPFIKSAPLLRDLPRTATDKKHQNCGVCRKPSLSFSADDLSNASEICSTLSESVSACTSVTEKSACTLVTEKRESRDEMRQLPQRSPSRSKNRSSSGEVNRVGKSPGRRPESSPIRSKPITGSGYESRRDSADSSERRSRSPVIRSELRPSKTGPGRNQSARGMGKSPGRMGSGSGERTRKVDGGKVAADRKRPPTNNESFENPLVSMECFIFL